MGYKVKWVEENLGVSRKALRNFEKHGLISSISDMVKSQFVRFESSSYCLCVIKK